MLLRALKVPIGWKDLARRTMVEVWADDCLNLAAQLSYYFFLSLFPALLFLVAIISFIPIQGLLETITSTLARVAPIEVIAIIQDQIIKVAHSEDGGLLTLGMLGTIWSISSGVNAIISTLNAAYDIQEGRPWWKVKLIAVGLTLTLAFFIVISFVGVMAGPTLAEKVAAWFYLGPAFTWTWTILQWPVVFGLVAFAIAIIYYYAPDAEQEWIWITPGSLFATALWLIVSLVFKYYVANFTSYNASYGAIGGVIVLLLWFYVSSLAILVGAELNAEIEHASPHGKDPGEKVAGEKQKLGRLAARAYEDHVAAGTFRSALEGPNCEVDKELPPASRPAPPRARVSDWLVGGLVLGETALLTYYRLRSRLKRLRG